MTTIPVYLYFLLLFTQQSYRPLTEKGTGPSQYSQSRTSTLSGYFTALPFDIVISEIMADPGPRVGLPEAEWVELKNRSGADVNLQGWRLGKPSGLSGPMPSYLLKKDSFVVVTTGSAVAGLAAFGPVITVTGFPALNNSGDLLYLSSPAGTIIHSVNYTDQWYQNELKKAGGWTLEMMDPNNPCSGSENWKASTDPQGGTPGKKNALDAVNPDKQLPRLVRAYATDSINIVLVFSEPLDSSSAAISSSYTISDGIGVAQLANPVAFVFDKVRLRLAAPLLRYKVYTATVTSVKDCAGNAISANNSTRVGLHENLLRHDVVVNEILFKPKPASNDYVELYNRSNKIINMRYAYLANRNSSRNLSSIVQLTAEDYLLFPNDFVVLTKNATLVKTAYVANNPDAFIELDLPAYNDDKGNVILLNEQGAIVDEIPYEDDWFFKLITEEEGVALERINYEDTTSDNPQTANVNEQAANWHSAATNIGYGTPTYKNSQYQVESGVQGTITVTPEIITPDNDGYSDFATIAYSFPESGYVANITILDAAGVPIRYLQRNALMGTSGNFRWDGLGERNKALLAGLYVIYTDVFNLQGKTKKFRDVVVLGKLK